jgi:hypothetical protein
MFVEGLLSAFVSQTIERSNFAQKSPILAEEQLSFLIRNHRRCGLFSSCSVIRSRWPPLEAKFFAKIHGSIV